MFWIGVAVGIVAGVAICAVGRSVRGFLRGLGHALSDDPERESAADSLGDLRPEDVEPDGDGWVRRVGRRREG